MLRAVSSHCPALIPDPGPWAGVQSLRETGWTGRPPSQVSLEQALLPERPGCRLQAVCQAAGAEGSGGELAQTAAWGRESVLVWTPYRVWPEDIVAVPQPGVFLSQPQGPPARSIPTTDPGVQGFSRAQVRGRGRDPPDGQGQDQPKGLPTESCLPGLYLAGPPEEQRQPHPSFLLGPLSCSSPTCGPHH